MIFPRSLWRHSLWTEQGFPAEMQHKLYHLNQQIPHCVTSTWGCCQKQGQESQISTLQGDYPSCVPSSHQGHAPRGSPAQSPAAGRPWAGIPAWLSSPPLSPLPDLLFLTGLASSVFVVSELVKLCEKRCCHPQHTKGCHNWLRFSKIHLEQSCDAG